MGMKLNHDPIDRAVRQFMADQGIDINRVNWYRVTKEHQGMATLEVKMFMNDMSEPATPAGEE